MNRLNWIAGSIYLASSIATADTAFLESCKAEHYESLKKQNKIFTSLAVFWSSEYPEICLRANREHQRNLILNNPDYLSTEKSDETYRNTTQSEISKIQDQNANTPEFNADNINVEAYQYNSINANRSANSNVLEGYTTVEGQK